MDAENVTVHVPDCLIIEIFTRLPLKSLCRFKCVSKFCLSFIQSPSFIKQIRPKTPILWQLRTDNVLSIYSIDANNGIATLKHAYKLEDAHKFLGYSNGLDCFLDNNLQLHVCNVVTKERVPLLSGYYMCVFCFDPLSKLYKVLGGERKSSGRLYDFQVFTLEKNPSWRPVTNTCGMHFLVEPNAFVNGEAFWMDYTEGRIISFNLANEEFRVIDLPNNIQGETLGCCIFEFEGSLSLVNQPLLEVPTFRMWILKESENAHVWIMMKENITMPFEDTSIHRHYSSGRLRWTVLASDFSSSGGELVVSNFDFQFVCSYSFLNNLFKTIEICGVPFSRGKKVRIFKENYVSLKELV